MTSRPGSRLRRAGVYALVLGLVLLAGEAIGGAAGWLHPSRAEFDADIVVLAIGCGLMALANRARR